MMAGYGMGFGWFGFLVMAVFWVAVIVAIVWLVTNLFPQKGQTITDNQPESPITILKKRYASGEINKEEFEAMRHDLAQ